MKTKVINLYGGPSSGKSTQASGLFYKMKQQGYNVELVNEFAKECVWEDNVPMLKDQLWVLAHQHRKLVRLRDKVDYIICLLYTSPSPRDGLLSRMPSSA